MSHTANIHTGSGKFRAVVDYGCETVHPDSPHRVKGVILDERVPLELIVFCDNRGAVIVRSERPKSVGPGKQVEKKLEVKFLELRQTWAVVPGKGNPGRWFQNWAYVPCYSEAHGNHLMDVLSGVGDLPDLNPVIV